MKKIAYTQRVEVINSCRERRDCADQNIPKFLAACGLLPVPVMNVPELVGPYCRRLSVDGILLTGGNDLAAYGGNAPERDETEKKLLEYALHEHIPLLGICRGMQFIVCYYGMQLKGIKNHVGKEHAVHGVIEREAVNSFHNFGTFDIRAPLKVLAQAEDGAVEAVSYERYKIAGIMWHPERVNGFSQKDISMTARFFEEGVLA